MKMRILLTLAVLLAMTWPALALDPVWGKWTLKTDPEVYVEFATSNITISTHGTQEVWKIVEGNVITGVTVGRGAMVLTAGCAVKFNEMLFRLGDRRWALRHGPKMDLGPGINAPLTIEDGKTNAANTASHGTAPSRRP